MNLNLGFLPGAEKINRDPDFFLDPSIDLCLVCDCSDGAYLPPLLAKLPQRPPLIVIDHHATNPLYGQVNLVEPNAASTCDVALRLINFLNLPLGSDGALCLLTGLCTDTVLFSTQNTNSIALAAASQLMAAGGRLPLVVEKTMRNQPFAITKLWGIACSRLVFDPDLGLLVTAIFESDLVSCQVPDNSFSSSDLSCFLNETLSDHPEHEVICLLTERTENNRSYVKGSLRSRSRPVDKLAQSFGGGGHKLAAGFKLDDHKIENQEGVWKIKRVAAENAVLYN